MVKEQLIQRNSKGKWTLKSKGSKKVSKTFKEKESAIEYGRKIAKEKRTALHVLFDDGVIFMTFDYRGIS